MQYNFRIEWHDRKMQSIAVVAAVTMGPDHKGNEMRQRPADYNSDSEIEEEGRGMRNTKNLPREIPFLVWIVNRQLADANYQVLHNFLESKETRTDSGEIT